MDQKEIQNVNSTNQILRFKYRNYKGEISVRSVTPIRTIVKRSPYHKNGEPCWIMVAIDLDKNAIRDFALHDIIEYYSIL